MATTLKEKWFVNESALDEEQYQAKNMALTNSYLVRGCAGSGKTILALWRAIEIMSQGQKCLVLVYTKALKQFISDALANNPYVPFNDDIVQTFDYWKTKGAEAVQHLIVDEAQDFTKEEIELLKEKAIISLALFGDSAQKLYKQKKTKDADGKEIQVDTLSIEEIRDLLGLSIRQLKNNHRLPKKIARFAQHLITTPDTLEHQCQKEGIKVPLLIECPDEASEISSIVSMIRSRGLTDVGILVPTNPDVERVMTELLAHGVPCEVKKGPHMDLNFQTDNPKIVTYHSAKGLQFQTVFIPYCTRFNSNIRNLSALYVACTRASEELVISYSKFLHTYMQNIPAELFEIQRI